MFDGKLSSKTSLYFLEKMTLTKNLLQSILSETDSIVTLLSIETKSHVV